MIVLYFKGVVFMKPGRICKSLLLLVLSSTVCSADGLDDAKLKIEEGISLKFLGTTTLLATINNPTALQTQANAINPRFVIASALFKNAKQELIHYIANEGSIEKRRLARMHLEYCSKQIMALRPYLKLSRSLRAEVSNAQDCQLLYK